MSAAYTAGGSDPAENAEAVTPHDTNELTNVSRAIWVGTGGDLAVVMHGSGGTITFTNVPDGTLLGIRVKQVRDTNTDAEDIVSLW